MGRWYKRLQIAH